MHIRSTRLRSISFKAKILILMYSVAAIPTVFLIFFLYNGLVASFEKNRMKTISYDFAQHSAMVDQKTDKCIAIASETSSNQILNDFFYMTDSEDGSDIVEYNSIVKPLLSCLQMTKPDEVGAIRFYTNNMNIFPNVDILRLQDYQADPRIASAIQSLQENSFSVQYFSEPRNFYDYTSPAGSLSLFTKMTIRAHYITYMEVCLNLNDIYSGLRSSVGSGSSQNYALIYNGNTVLFDSGHLAAPLLKDARITSQLSADHMHNHELRFQNKDLLLNAASLSYVNCTLIGYADFGKIKQPLIQNRTFFILISLGCVGILCVMCNLLVNKLLLRLSVIDENIRKIQKGNFDIHIQTAGNDSIDMISTNLNIMSMRIKQLIESEYKHKILLKNKEIDILTRQISPHFMYNTLECLKMQAELNDQKEISDGLTRLGKLLRYYARIGSGMSSVRMELDSITNYVSLMNLLHGNRCALRCEADPELLDRKLPTFLLQPFIENAIKHGLMPDRQMIHVKVTAVREPSGFHIAVQDDGAGIPPDVLARIREELSASGAPPDSQSRSHSIGIFNTNERLKLLYGDQCGIRIESVCAIGTTIHLHIPEAPAVRPDRDDKPAPAGESHV